MQRHTLQGRGGDKGSSVGWWMTFYHTRDTIALHDALITPDSLLGTLGELKLDSDVVLGY